MPLIIDGSNNTISASPSANLVFSSNVVFTNGNITFANSV